MALGRFLMSEIEVAIPKMINDGFLISGWNAKFVRPPYFLEFVISIG